MIYEALSANEEELFDVDPEKDLVEQVDLHIKDINVNKLMRRGTIRLFPDN